MNRKRLTQMFPFLLPLRVWQRKLFFYAAMRLDGQRYSQAIEHRRFDDALFQTSSPLYNYETGMDMVYQVNKVYNLKLAAKTIDGLVIAPGETFSFWRLAKKACRNAPYKDGLTLLNGELVTSPGGGLCQMSGFLFWIFLHSPLAIVERHSHRAKDFPAPDSDMPEGVDATVSEGWLDLKVKNRTDTAFQITIDFDDENIYGSLRAQERLPFAYEIDGRGLTYYRADGDIYQKIAVYRREIARRTRETIGEELLYENICRIGYELPEDTQITEIGEVRYGEV